MVTEDSRAGRAQPEAELLAAGSGTPRVRLSITNVYNSSNSEEVTLEPTDTIGDLKRMLQGLFANRPAPHQQRLIFRGKQCEEAQQIAHVLRGVDLSARQTLHLVVTQPTEQTEQPSRPTAASVQPPRSATGGASAVSSPETPRPPDTTDAGTTDTCRPSTSGPYVARAAAAASTAQALKPERVELSSTQILQLQWQYQQVLREQQQALQEQQQRFQFLVRQSAVLMQQGGRAPSSDTPLLGHYQQWRPTDFSEVATAAATRALGGSMPGPTSGGAVRDVTTGAPGMIQAAGLEEEDGRPVRQNLVDPAPVAVPARVNRRRLFLQLLGVVLVFGSDGDEWQLFLLSFGACLVFLYKSGFLEILLGEDREGRGIWKAICTRASVISEGGGVLTDVGAFFSTFFFSLFPPWKPTRSPEAIAAEAAAQEAAAAAVVEAARQRAEAEQAAASAHAERALPAEGEGAEPAVGMVM